MRFSGIGGRPILTGRVLAGGMGLAAILCYDLLYSSNGLLGERPPDLSPGRLLRSAGIFLSVFAVASGFTGGWPRGPQRWVAISSRAEHTLAAIGLCLSAFLVLLFLVRPAVFSDWSLEDGPIEWGSALLLLGASMVLLMALARGSSRRRLSASAATGLVLLAVVFFVIAMEEVSWFQRQLSLDAPLLFSANEQGEMNFHNFATNRIENVYYFGAFLFLVALPILRLLFPDLFVKTRIATFAPMPFVVVIGGLACAYNFDMWNIAFTQIAFFGSCIALWLLTSMSADRGERTVLVCALLLVVATQIVFLTNGERFSRLWEVTEYKELFIPLGFFAYSVAVYANTVAPDEP